MYFGLQRDYTFTDFFDVTIVLSALHKAQRTLTVAYGTLVPLKPSPDPPNFKMVKWSSCTYTDLKYVISDSYKIKLIWGRAL